MAETDERRDLTEQQGAFRQRLLPNGGALLPLRCCLLSGGQSRRMGRDKALLPHPEGGTWLQRTLDLLARLEAPVTLLSRHRRHLEVAASLGHTALAEPPPHEGPLPALARLMQQHPDQRLLLCPVDMPQLSLAALETLLSAAQQDPGVIHLAHDGRRSQPLLGIYPSTPGLRRSLDSRLTAGERRLQRWLAGECCRAVILDPIALRNINDPKELHNLQPWLCRGPSTTSDAHWGCCDCR
jgi:molybdenum cofactor guanylyltransferase